MELEYFFNGIEISDGKYPAARVLVRATPESTPPNLLCPRIEITLPISTSQCGKGLLETAGVALQSAKQLLNEKALSDWVATQSH